MTGAVLLREERAPAWRLQSVLVLTALAAAAVLGAAGVAGKHLGAQHDGLKHGSFGAAQPWPWARTSSLLSRKLAARDEGVAEDDTEAEVGLLPKALSALHPIVFQQSLHVRNPHCAKGTKAIARSQHKRFE